MGNCRCGARWSGLRTAHCASERSALMPLTVWDGDPSLGSHFDSDPDEGSIDVGRITPNDLADLVGTHTAEVKPRSFIAPRHGSMFRCMLRSAQGSEVRWTIVGPVTIDVVNLIFADDPAVLNPMLVGFDVRPRADLPPQEDVSVLTEVPTRLVLRNRLVGLEGPHGPFAVMPLTTDIAASPLPGTFDQHAAIHTFDGGHGWALYATAGCHETFGGITAFDRHRPGECLDPASIGLVVVRVSQGTQVWGSPMNEKAVKRFEQRKLDASRER